METGISCIGLRGKQELVDKYVDAWIVRHITVIIDICSHGKMTIVIWNVTLSILSEVYHHPIRTYCLHHHAR